MCPPSPQCREQERRFRRRALHNAAPPPANAHTLALISQQRAAQEAFEEERAAYVRERARAFSGPADGVLDVPAIAAGSDNALWVEGIG